MRGDAEQQTEMLLALTPDQLVPDDHPIRRIKLVVERVLARLSSRFNAMYAERGRPSIPPITGRGRGRGRPHVNCS
jgi:hypothetical protein